MPRALLSHLAAAHSPPPSDGVHCSPGRYNKKRVSVRLGGWGFWGGGRGGVLPGSGLINLVSRQFSTRGSVAWLVTPLNHVDTIRCWPPGRPAGYLTYFIFPTAHSNWHIALAYAVIALYKDPVTVHKTSKFPNTAQFCSKREKEIHSKECIWAVRIVYRSGYSGVRAFSSIWAWWCAY